MEIEYLDGTYEYVYGPDQNDYIPHDDEYRPKFKGRFVWNAYDESGTPFILAGQYVNIKTKTFLYRGDM